MSFYYNLIQGENMPFMINFTGGTVTFDLKRRKNPPKFTHLYFFIGTPLSSDILNIATPIDVLSHNISHLTCTSSQNDWLGVKNPHFWLRTHWCLASIISTVHAVASTTKYHTSRLSTIHSIMFYYSQICYIHRMLTMLTTLITRSTLSRSNIEFAYCEYVTWY